MSEVEQLKCGKLYVNHQRAETFTSEFGLKQKFARSSATENNEKGAHLIKPTLAKSFW